MISYFECKVSYAKIDEQTGKKKKVNLPYLVDAVSYTEAESRIHTEMKQYVSGEFDVPAIRKTKYTDIFFHNDGDKWHECKVEFVSIDEEAGKEKKCINKMLILADSVKEAEARINESLKDMTVDFKITLIKETKIADIFVYIENKESIPENLKPLEEEGSDDE